MNEKPEKPRNDAVGYYVKRAEALREFIEAQAAGNIAEMQRAVAKLSAVDAHYYGRS